MPLGWKVLLVRDVDEKKDDEQFFGFLEKLSFGLVFIEMGRFNIMFGLETDSQIWQPCQQQQLIVVLNCCPDKGQSEIEV